MSFKLKSQSPLKQEVPPGKVKYGTPEYRSAYKKGEVLSKDGNRSPVALEEVVIKTKPKKEGFWKQSINKYTKENADSGLFGALGSVITYPLQVPQDAATYAATGKVQRPSEALNIKNKVGALAADIALDPVNLVGGSVIKNAVKSGVNALSKKALAPIVKTGVKEVTRQVEGLVTKQPKLSKVVQETKDEASRIGYKMGLNDASILPREDYVKTYVDSKVKVPGFKGKQLERRLRLGKENVSKALNANLDWVESNRYIRNRSANTGETEKEVVESVNDYKNKFMDTKLNFLDDPAGKSSGSYNVTTKSYYSDKKPVTRKVYSIEAEVKASGARGKYYNVPENTLDHEIGHAFSPVGKKDELYKNYPTIKTHKGIDDQAKGKTYDNIYEIPYLDKPQEQQVRIKRLSQDIRRSFGLGLEERLTTKQVKSYKDSKGWKSNNPRGMWGEHSDVADLFISSPPRSQNVTNLTRHLNKAWMAPAVTAGFVGKMMNKDKK